MKTLLENEQGTATIEYLSLLVLMTISLAGTLYALGPGIVGVFRMQVFWLALPVP